jgi:hypothetical protein
LHIDAFALWLKPSSVPPSPVLLPC